MDWKAHVESALDGRHPGLGHWVEVSLHVVIVYSTIALGVETLPNLSPAAHAFLRDSEIVVVVIFTVEYLLRLISSPLKWRYATSFYGFVDLLAIAPFYLGFLLAGAGFDMRAIRALRLLRLVRLFKLARYTAAIDRMVAAWKAVRDEIIVFTVTSVVVLYVCALVIYQCEHDAQPKAFASVFDAMWWAAVTLTTVGYGDIYPITPLGRLFTVFMLFLALGIVAVPTGLVASAMVAIRHKENEEEKAEKTKKSGEEKVS